MDTNLIQTEQPAKLKITTRQMVDAEISVNLPYFSKYGTGAFYKVLSKKCSIVVQIWECTTTSIEVRQDAYVHPESVQITEEEFNTAYNTALNKLVPVSELKEAIEYALSIKNEWDANSVESGATIDSWKTEKAALLKMETMFETALSKIQNL